MIRQSVLLGLFLFTFSCQQKGNDQTMHSSQQLTKIRFETSLKEMGTIPEGEKIEVAFPFSNIGDHPLVIQDVKASCGCTIPAKPEKPVLPGETGTITAVFNSSGRAGINSKTITVIANTSETSHELHFNVEVTPKPNQ